ncbi:DUF721 domain-containing protein [Candidatus Poriferisocius sp.]|uniref:DUF721 domain-containing protein n=1 Tax=Candidatus Poriferisocius sp. TaxID=3101276 RepID=UPI003B023228
MTWKPLYEQPGPKRLGESLHQVTSQLKIPQAHFLKIIFQKWDEIVGSVMAAHVSPVRLLDGELVVIVDDPAWATEMKFFCTETVARINDVANEEVVTNVIIKVRPQ